MSELSTVTQAQSGGFIVLDPTSIEQSSVKKQQPTPENAPSDVDLQVLEKKKQQELEKSFEQGRQRGLDEAEMSFSQITKALALACEEIASLKQKMLERSKADMLRLVFAISERVIHANIVIDTEVVTRAVNQAIQLAVSSEEFHIKVNPEDLQTVNDHKPLFIASLSGLSNIEFVPDESVARGGCIVESPLGRVDATVEAQMDAISTCLDEAIKGE
jgi:flagellar assembly protein FliH